MVMLGRLIWAVNGPLSPLQPPLLLLILLLSSDENAKPSPPTKTKTLEEPPPQQQRSRRVMPKSKRNRPVTLSKTKKKPGSERKGKVVAEIKKAVDEYSSAYVFTYDNMRNQKLKDLREQLKSSSRIFLAGKKVMQIALGRSPADEAKTGLHKLSKFLQGDSGLFFTNLPRDEVERLFREFEGLDFARTGSTATETVELKEGPLEQFTHEMEPFLRKQGLPVRLNRGIVELVADHVVCDEGKPLSPEAAQTLRLLGIQMATFRLYLVCRWSCDDFEVYKEGLVHLGAYADS